MLFYSLTKKIVLIAISIVAFTTVSHADTTGLLLFAPFQNDATATVANGVSKPDFNNNVKITSGKIGNAASVIAGQSQLVYDGPGNAYSQAGTASFYWRLDADPAGKDVTILQLSPLENTDQGRYLVLSYGAGKFSLYLSGGNIDGQTLTSQPIMVLPREWHQLTLCWDQTYGAALLVDGDVAFQSPQAWIYEGAIGSIGLGATIIPGRAPSTAFSQSFDEFRIYDRWLDDPNLQRLIHSSAASVSQLDTEALTAVRQKFYQWNTDNAAKLPQVKVAIGGGLGLRQASVDDAQQQGKELFDGERAAFWPADKSAFNQTLPIIMVENQPFDIVQIFGIGHLRLTSDQDNKTLLDFQSQDIASQSFTMPASVGAQHLSLQTLPPGNQDTFTSSAAYNIQFFKQIRYPYDFDNSWQQFSLRPATGADQSLDELLHIRQAFYSCDQQTFMTQIGTASGQITIPAMQTFHIVGPAASQGAELDAVAIELKLLPSMPGFARVQIADPQNPLHFLASVDVHLNNGPGTMRLMIENRDVQFPQGARPVISITFSDDATIDAAGSSVRYQWKK